VIRHEPSCCAGCERGLAGAPEAGVIRRQVTEIPLVRTEVTEHRLIGRVCGCGAVTWGKAPDGVTAPVQYGPRAVALGVYLWHGQFLSRDRARAAMADMFGCAPSAGALAAMTRAGGPAFPPVRFRIGPLLLVVSRAGVFLTWPSPALEPRPGIR
jgi:transposase